MVIMVDCRSTDTSSILVYSENFPDRSMVDPQILNLDVRGSNPLPEANGELDSLVKRILVL
jgi:hypothetical protein